MKKTLKDELYSIAMDVDNESADEWLSANLTTISSLCRKTAGCGGFSIRIHISDLIDKRPITDVILNKLRDATGVRSAISHPSKTLVLFWSN